jgi:hypothetical protein
VALKTACNEECKGARLMEALSFESTRDLDLVDVFKKIWEQLKSSVLPRIFLKPTLNSFYRVMNEKRLKNWRSNVTTTRKFF